MRDFVLKEKELISVISKNLEEIRIFLVGRVPTETAEEQQEAGLIDVMRNNVKDLEDITKIVSIMKGAIMGGND